MPIALEIEHLRDLTVTQLDALAAVAETAYTKNPYQNVAVVFTDNYYLINFVINTVEGYPPSRWLSAIKIAIKSIPLNTVVLTASLKNYL